jgi:hypothetical protein
MSLLDQIERAENVRTTAVNPAGREVRLPAGLLDQFYNRQRAALQQFVEQGRERAATVSALGFGQNRIYRSRIEAKIAWWRRAMADPARLAKNSQKAAGNLVEADWDQVGGDISDLAGKLSFSLWRAFDAHLGRQALRAVDEWPIDTGLSLSLLQVELDVGMSVGELMRAALIAGAPYSPYIEEAGFNVAQFDITEGGKTTTIRRRVRLEGRRMLPAKAARYLKQDSAGKWYFDRAQYDADKMSGALPGKGIAHGRRAVGHPYRDLLLKPTDATVAAIGRDATTNAVGGA